MELFLNPFRPGAGHPPPYLAGREKETNEFRLLLEQKPILKNLVITGLRGVGKTVLLESLRPIAVDSGYFWAGTDLSESSSESEHTLSIRLLTDLFPILSSFSFEQTKPETIGFMPIEEKKEVKFTYDVLLNIYQNTPGLEADKLKNVLQIIWNIVKLKVKGIVIAYDEAQILKDKAKEKQYPFSLLLEVIQYLQRMEIPYFMVLTGLPTLVTTLSETRTYTERMFQILTLDKLNERETREAILKPIQQKNCPVTFSDIGINEIIKYSGGYPYFIQFFCKETFDSVLQHLRINSEMPFINVGSFIRKLDADFYAGRWSRVSDRQRELLIVMAKLPNSNDEFTAKDISAKSSEVLKNSFSPAYVVNTLVKLIAIGLVYKNRRGKYSFAVPMLADYINRQDIELPF